MDNPLKAGYADEEGFIGLCSDMCVAQSARNKYIHSTLSFMANPHSRPSRRGEIAKIFNLASDMLCRLHELTFA